MKCEETEDLLVERWNDSLEPEDGERLERHLAECARCREEAERLDETWARLGALDLGALDGGVAVPSDRLRARFYGALAELEREGEGRGREPWHRRLIRGFERVWPERPAWQMAGIAAALVAGVFLGSLGGENGTREELARLRGDMDTMSRVVAISLLEHPSASERLRGVSWGRRASGTDERVVGALLETVREDESVNVRLAAVEALAGRIEDGSVRRGLIETLPDQGSPLVQMFLLDLLLPESAGEASNALEDLLEREDLDRAVRQRILDEMGTEA